MKKKISAKTLPKVRRNETPICIDFVKDLSILQKFKSKVPFVFFHVANEGINTGRPVFGSILKMMGKRSGVADYIFMWENGCGAIEFKRDEKCPLTEGQIDFKDECESKNIKYALAYSPEQGIEILKGWGLIEE